MKKVLLVSLFLLVVGNVFAATGYKNTLPERQGIGNRTVGLTAENAMDENKPECHKLEGKKVFKGRSLASLTNENSNNIGADSAIK